MKLFFNLVAGIVSLSAPLMAEWEFDKINTAMPIIEYKNPNWEKVPNVAQYHSADWSGLIGKAENVTLKEAIDIAESNPDISYFFYMTGFQMVLGGKDRIFRQGDAVFFTGTPSWGNATGYADGYVKKQ